MLPDLLDQTAEEYAIELAYASGEFAERERIATATAELDATWRAIGADLYRDRIAEDIAEMERKAAEMPANTWRGNFPGGPTRRIHAYAKPVRPFRFKHDPAAYEFVDATDDDPETCLVLATPVPWEPEGTS